MCGRMIITERLDLVPATPQSVRSAMRSGSDLGAYFGAAVPLSWPPMYFDTPALEFTLVRLEEHPDQSNWWLHFVLLRGAGASRTLVGTAGYTGPPSADGTVEVGYSIVSEHQKKGLASEAVRGMVSHAFSTPAVRRVIAETLPGLDASIGVLLKCGFRLTDERSEPGVIRYELTRDRF